MPRSHKPTHSIREHDEYLYRILSAHAGEQRQIMSIINTISMFHFFNVAIIINSSISGFPYVQTRLDIFTFNIKSACTGLTQCFYCTFINSQCESKISQRRIYSPGEMSHNLGGKFYESNLCG